MVVRPIVVHNNSQEGFGHYTDQNTPFGRWKQIGRLRFRTLYPNGPDIGEHWKPQNKELIDPGA